MSRKTNIIMRLLTFALAVLLPLATQAQAEEPPRYSAQDTLRRAQVGSFSPAAQPPVRVTPGAEVRVRRDGPNHYERLVCREDPAQVLAKRIICEPKRN